MRLRDAVFTIRIDAGDQEASRKLEVKGERADFNQLLRMEPDSGTTNIRNTESGHWKRWLGVAHRCVMPFTSFSEFNKRDGGNIWFALDKSRPLAFFAGIHVPKWTSVRKVKDGDDHRSKQRGSGDPSQGDAGDPAQTR